MFCTRSISGTGDLQVGNQQLVHCDAIADDDHADLVVADCVERFPRPPPARGLSYS